MLWVSVTRPSFGLEQCKDLYGTEVDVELCEQLIDLYDKSGRQLYNLSSAWSKFKERQT